MWARCEPDARCTDTISHNPGTHRMTGQPTLTSGTGARGQRWNCLASSWVLLASVALIAIFGPVTMLLYRSGH